MMHDGNDKTRSMGTEIQSASELEAYSFESCVDPDSGAISAWSDCEYGVDDNSIKGYYISVDGSSD